ncbi:MAG: divergent polysaccharide deacetylase family protein, partial [Pseudomonadota bacterium]
QLEPLMKVARTRGLLYVDSRTSGRSIALDVARRHGIPSAGRDIFLDHPSDDPAGNVRRQLRAVERVAQANGAAIAIGHPHPSTLRALRVWIPTLAAKGIDLVPASALVDAPGPIDPMTYVWADW